MVDGVALNTCLRIAHGTDAGGVRIDAGKPVRRLL